jgi:lysophospholipase
MNGKAAADLFPTPGNVPPPGGRSSIIHAADGTGLRAAHWAMPADARGTVIVLQGRAEMIEKYFETVSALQSRKLAVATLDWRGQGGSARLLPNPLKGHVRDFAEYLDDLDAFMAQVIEPSYPRPYHVLGHSLGGLIALLALRKWPGRFSSLVTIAPLLGVHTVSPLVARLIARMAPAEAFVPGGARFNPLEEAFESNPVTRDAGRFARNVGIIGAHPQLALGSPTCGWLKAAYQAMDQALSESIAPSITVPVFIATAEDELIVDNALQAQLASRLSRGRHIIIPGARHEILMERDDIRWAFWRHWDAFFESFRLAR